jgi:2-polyprenyl-3-methyl-5-hydroxy-6-metoxy-1,4-benzoquinol methylase
VSVTPQMVKLSDLDQLSPEDLWRRRAAIHDAVVARVLASGPLAPAITCCPICGSSRLFQFSVKSGLNIDCCASCDFRFTNPPPSAEQLNLYYNSEAKELENLVFERTLPQRVPIFARRVELIMRYCTEGKLLDVGGAIGIFVDALQAARAPFKVTIVDLNADAIARVHNRHPTVTALNESILGHRQSYDVVTLFDTMEHLPDVNRTAGHLFDLIRPGGYLFIAAPNMASFEYSVGMSRHPQVVPIARLSYFSPGNLRHLLERHGFHVIDFVTPNGSFDVAYVKRMLEEGTAELGNLGDFLRSHLQSADFAEDFAQLISRHGLAGNMVMISQRPVE